MPTIPIPSRNIPVGETILGPISVTRWRRAEIALESSNLTDPLVIQIELSTDGGQTWRIITAADFTSGTWLDRLGNLQTSIGLRFALRVDVERGDQFRVRLQNTNPWQTAGGTLAVESDPDITLGPEHHSITLVSGQTGSAAADGGGTTLGATVPGDVTAGNLIVSAVGSSTGAAAATSVTDDLTNTYTEASGSPYNSTQISEYLGIWLAPDIAGGAAGSITANWGASTTFRRHAVAEFDGTATASVQEGSMATGQGSSTTASTSSLSPSQDGCMLIGWCNDASVPTVGSGFSSLATYGSDSLFEYRVQTTATSEPVTAGISPSASWGIVGIIVKPAGDSGNLNAAPAMSGVGQTFVPDPGPGYPVFNLAGSQANGTSSVVVSWPAHATNDIGLMLVQTDAQATTMVTAAGWVQVSNSPQSTGTAAATNAVALQVFWKRAANAAEVNVTMNDAGSHVLANIITFTNCVQSGNPWNITSGNVKGTASTNVAVTGGTTTANICLIVDCVAGTVDTTTIQCSTIANGSLGSYAEILDRATTSGGGGQVYAGAGQMAASGAIPQTTATVASSTKNAWLRIALVGTPWSGPGIVRLENPAMAGVGTVTFVQTISGTGAMSVAPALAATGIAGNLGAGAMSVAPTLSGPQATNTLTVSPQLNRPALTLGLSSFIPASGATATTARLTSPTGKTSADFQAGTIQDDTNPAPSLDLGVGKYTELEWSLKAIALRAGPGEVYEFRVVYGASGVALEAYLQTPQLTIGNAGIITVAPVLSGTGTQQNTGTGALSVSVSLAGTGTQQNTGTGSLSIAPSLSGTGTQQYTGTGSLSLTPALAGTGIAGNIGSGDLSVTPAMAGSGTATMEFTGTGSLTVSLTLNGPQTTSGLTVGPSLNRPALTLGTSSFIAGGGATGTTARLVPPTGKTSADFQAGTIQDDTNPAPSLDLGSGKYTELEWSLKAIALRAGPGEAYEFRIVYGATGLPLEAQLQTPQLTIGNAGVLSVAPVLSGTGTAAGAISGTGSLSLAPALAGSGIAGNTGTGSLSVTLALSGPHTTSGMSVGAQLNRPALTLAPSSFIASGGATATTARLTPPTGKTSTDFQAGTIQDDTNPAPSLDLGAGKYTELEWSLKAIALRAGPGEVYEFRIAYGASGIPLEASLQTPQWTIGNAAVLSITPVLSGTGSLGFSGTGSLSVAPSLAATGTQQYSGTGSLSVAPAFAGTGIVGNIGSGDLSVTVSLEGTGTVSGAAVTGDGSLTASPALSGTGLAGNIGSGDLSVTPAFAGTGVQEYTGTGSLAVTIALSGSGSDVLSGTGSLIASPALSGTGIAGNLGTGSLAVSVALAGTGNDVLSGTGSLAVTLAMEGTGGQAGVGILTAQPALAGEGLVGVVGSGALSVTPALAATGSDVISGTGDLSVTVSPSGSGTQLFSGSGSLSLAPVIAGTGNQPISGSGALELTVITMAGSGYTAPDVDGVGGLEISLTLNASGEILGLVIGPGAMLIEPAFQTAGVVDNTTGLALAGKYRAEHAAALRDVGQARDFAAEHAAALRDVTDAGA